MFDVFLGTTFASLKRLPLVFLNLWVLLFDENLPDDDFKSDIYDFDDFKRLFYRFAYFSL